MSWTKALLAWWQETDEIMRTGTRRIAGVVEQVRAARQGDRQRSLSEASHGHRRTRRRRKRRRVIYFEDQTEEEETDHTPISEICPQSFPPKSPPFTAAMLTKFL